MPGILPVVLSFQLDAGVFFIPLSPLLRLSDGSIHIPVRREGSDRQSVTFELDAVYYTTGNGTCTADDTVLGVAGSYVGCVESVLDNGNPIDAWTLVPRTGLGPQEGVTTLKGDGMNRLWLMKPNMDAPYVFCPYHIIIPTDTLTFYLDEEIARAVLRDPVLSLKFTREQASALEFAGVFGTITIVPRGPDGFFYFRPEVESPYDITAICDDNRYAKCRTTFVPEGKGLALVQYRSDDGVQDLARYGNQSEGALLPSVNRQLVKITGNRTVVKQWEGAIDQVATFDADDIYQLEWVFDESDGRWTIVSALLGGISVPFNAEEFYEDPEGFIEQFGVEIPDEGPTADVALFRPDGTLRIGKQYLSKKTFETVISAGINPPSELTTSGAEAGPELPELPENPEIPGTSGGGSAAGVFTGSRPQNIVVGFSLVSALGASPEMIGAVAFTTIDENNETTSEGAFLPGTSSAVNRPHHSSKLSLGATLGIVAGIVTFISVVGVTIYLVRTGRSSDASGPDSSTLRVPLA